MGVTDPVWTALTRTYGRKAVMNPHITDATLDAETERQAAEIFPLIRAQIQGDEQTALDYGCGYGRFMPYLASLVEDIRVTGFDTCPEMLDLIYWGGHVVTNDWAVVASEHYDLIFTAMVLGDPNLNSTETAAGIASIMAPGGTLVVLDHMPPVEPSGRWWRFRPEKFYTDLFNSNGIPMRKIGMVRQLDDQITILAGRKS